MEPIAFLLLPGFSAIAFFSALEPLRIANRLAGRTLYRWTVHAPDGDHAEASNGMLIRADHPLGQRAETLIVCAGFDPLRHASRALLGQLRRAWRLGARLGAIDTGAFLLAEAGILGAEPITLHWEAAAEFRRRWPRIPLSGELYERHARLFTCAGGTAAMDMMLEGIARDHGPALARAVAEQLIHERIRPASAPQRAPLAPPPEPLVAEAVALMRQRLAAPLAIDQLAQRLGVERRRLERRFAAVLGCSPAQHYRGLRLSHALEQVRSAALSLAEGAQAAGYSSAAVMARACRQHYGLSPSQLLKQG
jgi:AraC family carnitine catabolism transcriptional activator